MSKTYVGYVPRPTVATNAEEFVLALQALGVPLYATAEESLKRDADLGIPPEDSNVARITIEIVETK